MSWQQSGRVRTWWVDPTEGLVVWSRPIMSEFEDPEEGPNPLDLLTHKQRFVVELRYGLVDGIEYQQSEIAGLMGITQQMVAKHEKAALKKLADHVVKRGCKNPLSREESK